MHKLATPIITFLLVITALFSSPSGAALAIGNNQQAQDNKQSQIDEIINRAEKHYTKGEEAYKGGQYDFARGEFDQAIDTIFIASIDVRSDDRLRIYYRQLVEKINRYQIESLEAKDGGFSEQRYEPSPLDRLASLSEADLDEVVAADVDLINTKFNFDFDTAYPVRQFIEELARAQYDGSRSATLHQIPRTGNADFQRRRRAYGFNLARTG